MANKSVEEKVCALMGLWVRYRKELEIVSNLIELTAMVAKQYVDEALGATESTPAKTKVMRRAKKTA